MSDRDLAADKRYPADAGDGQELPLDRAVSDVDNEDEVEDASEDSFPASDPPSFTGTSASRDSEADPGDR